MSCCKCCSPVITNFEFEISNDIIVSSSNISSNIKIPIEPITDIDQLKEKVICEYLYIISELEKGNTPNLEFILEEISLIDLYNEIDNREFVVLYYLNNKI